jgi:hypothetical protein
MKASGAAPAFNLPNQDGVEVGSADLLRRGPLVRATSSRRGMVFAADYDPDYTRRPEPEKTIADLRKLRSG